VALLALAIGGCATPGKRLQRDLIAGGAPHPREILADLAANDGAIETFQVRGARFDLLAPSLSDGRVIGRSTLAFSRSGHLYFDARHLRLNTLALKFAAADGRAYAWIREGGDHREEFWREGDSVEGLPIQIEPSDLVREAFFPERWDGIPARDVRLEHYDEASATASLSIGPANNPRRRIEVVGTPWRIVRNVYFENGAEVADTHLTEYRVYDGGIRFPSHVEAHFVQADATMTIKLPRTQAPRFNEVLKREWFEKLRDDITAN
jgi:hypothetical protein